MKKLIALLESKAFSGILDLIIFLIVPGCAARTLLLDGHKILAYLLVFSMFVAIVVTRDSSR